MRILTFTGIVLCVLLMSSCRNNSDPMAFVPEESLLIAELKHPPKWYLRNSAKQNSRFLLLNSVINLLENGDVLLKAEKTLRKEFISRPLTICWFLSDRDVPTPLFIQAFENAEIKNIEQLLKSSRFHTTERKFRDVAVYSIETETQEFHFCIIRGVMLSSSNPLILEKGISAYSRRKVFGLNKDLMALRNLLIESYDLQVYYHPEKLQLLINSMVSENTQAYLGEGNRSKGWMALGLHFEKNELLYKAFGRPGSAPEPLNTALNTESLKNSLPADLVQLQARVCPGKLLPGRNPRAVNLLRASGLKQTASFLTNPLDDQPGRYRVWMLELLRPQSLINALEQHKLSDSISAQGPEKYQEELAELLTASGWTNHLSADSLFWFSWQQQIYISADRQSIRQVASQLMAGRTYQGKEISASPDQMPCQELQFLSFEANALLPQYLFSERDPGLLQILSGGFSLQEEYRYHDQIWYLNGKVNLSARPENPSEMLLWQIPEIIPEGPVSIIERPENQDHIIVVQDSSGDVIVLSRSGDVLSRFAVGDSLLGKVYAADPYGTGRMHLLFMSSNKIWLTDMEGHSLQGFPLKLPASAAAPFSLSGKGRQMKIFVPLLNGNIHGYTLGGKPLKSWNPRLSGGVASQPLLCGYDGIGKFWLAQLSDNGQLQVWDSLGQNVFQAVETGKIHPGKVQLLKDSAGNPSWMFCSEEQVFSCAFNGSVRIWETADTNLCLNITEKDGRMVLLLSGRGNIRRYSGDWEFEDVMKTSNQETAETDTLSLNGKNLILINDQINRKLSVYDPEFRAALLKEIQYGLFPVLSSRLFAGQLIMIESDAQKGIGARRLH